MFKINFHIVFNSHPDSTVKSMSGWFIFFSFNGSKHYFATVHLNYKHNLFEEKQYLKTDFKIQPN